MELYANQTVLLSDFQELYTNRELLQTLVFKQLKERYRETFLGLIWTLMSPLLLMIVYSLVFSVYMRNNMPNYSVFLFCGLLPWLWFSQALIEGTNSILMGSNLVTKSMFPSKILPTVSVLSTLINFLLSLPILFVFIYISHIKISLPALAIFPLLVVIQVIFTEGIVLLTSSLNVFYRDIQHLLNNLITFWFFLTPVLYSVDMVPQKYKWLIMINPLAPLMIAYQDVLFYQRLPNWSHLGWVTLVSFVILIVGSLVFKKHREYFAEVL